MPSPPTLDVTLKRFDQPDEVRHFARGRFELVTLGAVTIGRATYEPGRQPLFPSPVVLTPYPPLLSGEGERPLMFVPPLPKSLP